MLLENNNGVIIIEKLIVVMLKGNLNESFELILKYIKQEIPINNNIINIVSIIIF